MIETQLEKKIKTLQTDWGGEFRSFVPFLKENGILFRHSCPHSHHQNGRGKRKHRHIVETGLTLLAQASIPTKYWWQAFETATFLINRMPTLVLNRKSPYEIIYHQKPDYKFMKVFGCACFPHLRPYNSYKLDFRTAKCVFIGYSSQQKGYMCLHSSRRVYIAINVVFNEFEFPFQNDKAFQPTVSEKNTILCPYYAQILTVPKFLLQDVPQLHLH